MHQQCGGLRERGALLLLFIAPIGGLRCANPPYELRPAIFRAGF
jgi:hypothetical protein